MRVSPLEHGVAVEDFLNVFVGHPLLRMDDAFVKRIVQHLARCAKGASSRSRQPSVLGFNEHRWFETFSGSIGMTRSGKYTDVPRHRASMSIAESGGTKCETSAM